MANPPSNPSRKPGRASNANLPPLEERLGFRLGVMTHGKRNEVAYNWPAIESLWYAWAGTNEEFCRYLGIPRETLITASRERAIDLSDTRKQAIRSAVHVGYRSEVLRLAGAHRVANPDEPSRLLNEILRDLVEVSRLSVSYAKARAAKLRNGTLTANPNVPPSEMRILSQIASDSANTLRTIFEIEREITSRTERRRKIIESTPKALATEPSETPAQGAGETDHA